MKPETERRISLAEAGDIPKILEIANWAATNTTSNFATEPESLESWMSAWQETSHMYPWVVAKSGSNVIGFAKAAPHRNRGAYAWTAEVSVYVQHDFQGRGQGRALYRRIIPLLRHQGYVTLLAGITSPNPASERLHTRFGFTRCGIFHRAGWKHGEWQDVGYWELHLQPPGFEPQAIKPVLDAWSTSSIGSRAPV